MPNSRQVGWSRLDNAAKIFPSTSERSDTRVFRFSCQLTEPIVEDLLQQAVLSAAETFPQYLVVMKRGIFWYYLEQTSLRPVVDEERHRPCAPLYFAERPSLLFRVSYYRRRINLEIYHVLSDGTGALEFLKTIVVRYLQLRYPEELAGGKLVLRSAPVSEKNADSFQKYYQKVRERSQEKSRRAYHLRGERREEDDLQLIEGIASVKQVLEAAHQYHTTLTIFLTAVYIQAIQQEMYLRDQKHPVVIRVPVNLRSYFPSETAKNFFGMIEVAYDFSQSPGDFDDIIRVVDETFKRELKRERLEIRMNRLAQLEHNPLIQLVPLPIKNVVLRMARHINDVGETAVISNIGRVTLPEAACPYVESFHVFASTLKTQICLCSFGDRLQMGFASAFETPGLQRNFFRLLTEKGILVQINATDTLQEPAPQPQHKGGKKSCGTATAAK